MVKQSSTPLSRSDWIKAGQQMLIKSGIDSVRVETLAQNIGITRGSFYHHFKGRNELLQEILVDWKTRATDQVIRRLKNTHYPPREQLAIIFNLPTRGESAKAAADFELAIRAWARRDKVARKMMDDVDTFRLDYISELVENLGFEKKEACQRGFLIYSYLVTLSLSNPNDWQKGLFDEDNALFALLLPEICDTEKCPKQDAESA